ncbi:MAG: helix-turn-helix transcriptional regulator [Candidatus Thiodiazotropha taylori]
MNTEFPYPEVGARIKQYRNAKQITQEELAKGVGISRASLANIESGRQRVLLHQLYGFAEQLGLDLFQLIPARKEPNMKFENDELIKNVPPEYLGDAQKFIDGI